MRMSIANKVALVACAAFASVCANAQTRPERMSANAERQIAALLEEKALRSKGERKMDGHLVHAAKILRGRPVHKDFPAPADAVAAAHLDADNRVEVDIRADVTDAMLGAIRNAGGQVINALPAYRAVRAKVSIFALEQLAERAEIQEIAPAAQWVHASAFGTAGMEKKVIRQNIAGQLQHLFSGIKKDGLPRPTSMRRKMGASFFAGIDVSGDVAHQANVARTTYGVDGTGVKIGLLSGGLLGLEAEQAAGRLPAVNLVAGSTVDGEGTAMLEIIYSLAPGAKLYFATADGGPANMVNNIQKLADAGCNIILDDIFYFGQPVFRDGLIARKVNDVTAAGVFYFSAAGNDGSLAGATSSVWEGDFNDGTGSFGSSPPPIGVISGKPHTYGNPAVNYNTITGRSAFNYYVLEWSDPPETSSNDYDLFILNSALTRIIASSTNLQTGTSSPMEVIPRSTFIPTGSRIVIINHGNTAAKRALYLKAEAGQLFFATSGAISAQAASERAFAIGAIGVGRANGGAFTAGPQNYLEDFSSDGPRRKFYDQDSKPLTPGNLLFSTGGGVVVNKPDFVAADGVPTGVTGFSKFLGTSASVGHAAAIAALMKQAHPSITYDQLREGFTASAIDVAPAGWDINSGRGIIMAPAAVAKAREFASACTVSLGADATSYSSAAAAGSVSISSAGCDWSASSSASWITVSAGATGKGNGAASYLVAPNNSGTSRTSQITISGKPFTVTQSANLAGQSAAVTGGLAQVAAGGTFTTGIIVMNTGTAAANYAVSFFDDNGAPLTLPGLGSAVSGNLAPGATAYHESSGGQSALVVGSALIVADPSIVAHALFRNKAEGTYYEAAVPTTAGARDFTIPFDTTTFATTGQPFATGFAIANLDSSSANVNCTARETDGGAIANALPSLTLAAHGHWADYRFPALAGRRGTIRCTSDASVSAVVLRFIGANSLSSLPVAVTAGSPNPGVLAQIAAGGILTTGIFVFNTGSAAANYSVEFLNDQGGALTFPFSSGAASSIAGSLAGGGLAYYEASNPGSDVLAGWGRVTADPSIVVHALYRVRNGDKYYEAAVPTTPSGKDVVIPFDATTFVETGGAFVTGIALANLETAPVNVTCAAKDALGNLVVNAVPALTLSARGHWADFNFPALVGKRGTIECTSPGNISGVSLRFSGAGSFFSLPVSVLR